MSDSIGTVILAAGQGTRLKLDCAKPLAPILGKRLVDFPLNATWDFYKDASLDGNISVVIGHDREKVKGYLEDTYSNSDDLHFAVQEKQLGTADALRSYFDSAEFTKNSTYTVVMCADTPIISSEDLTHLYNFMKEQNLDGVAATFIEDNPKGYGRIVRGAKGFHIVEEKDATDEIRKITEVNSGFYVLKTSFILENLYSIDSNNKSGEFYLTDLFKDEYNVAPICFEDKDTFLGVNTLEQLESAEAILRRKNQMALMASGVRFIDRRHTYVDSKEVGAGTVIYPNVFIEGDSKIGKNVIIEPGCIIKDSIIEDGVEVKAYSHLEGVILRAESVVGPYARLRPGADVGANSKIGNFVEIKKSKLDEGVKVSHLSYVGDAEIGAETNIGCGFITCNYDGASKHKTIIGKGSFIGSDTQMIAPVTLGDKSYVASGSTITHDMPEGSFAIARQKQVTKEGMAKRFLKSKK